VIKYLGNSPYIPAEFKNLKNPAWLNDLNNYHNVGDVGRCWGNGNCTKLGDFYGLDDLATEKPVVYKGWADVYGRWISKYGISAFRVDTARHVDDKFFKNWSPLIKTTAKKSGIKDFTIFGEVFDYSTLNLMTYVRQNKIETVLDFPFQAKATEYASGYSNAPTLSALFENDDYYISAQSSPSNLVTFLGNHDVGRVGYIIANKRIQPVDQLLPRTNLANALMYFSRGIPVVYYGDEVGMTGSNSGKDQFARQDMFKTDIELWKNETRVGGLPIGDGDAFSATSQSPVANYLIKLAEIRKSNPALANGPMLERYSKNALYVISKKDVVQNREYIVAFNNSDTDEIVTVTTATSGGDWTQILGTTKVEAKLNVLSFNVPALSTIVLKAGNTINQFATKHTKLSTSVDDLTGFYKVKAGISSKDFLSVEFFARNVGSTKWLSQGVDTAAPYSIFIDPLDFPRKKIELRAIARNSKGENFAFPITRLTISAP
jgi:glycosidase